MSRSTIEFMSVQDQLEKVLNEMNATIKEQGTMIAKQAKQIKKMKKIIKTHEEQNNRTKESIYQLLGGLYHHKKQGNVLSDAIDYLDGKTREIDIDVPAYWNIWPTTRQGDICEEKIKILEERISQILEIEGVSVNL